MTESKAGCELLEDLRPRDLPHPPGVALQLIQACSQASITHRALAEIAACDPVLTAEVLRLANSAFFGLVQPVRTVSHAVLVLGQRALRNLVLCIAMREALGKMNVSASTLAEFWQEGLRRAVAAFCVGRTLGMDPDECLTAGLLQECGILVILHREPEQRRALERIRGEMPQRRVELEQQVCGTDHAWIGERLGRVWGLPEEFCRAIGVHHQANPCRAPGLARVLYCAEWLASVLEATDREAVRMECRCQLQTMAALDEKVVERCLIEIPPRVEEAARALDLIVPPQASYDEIMQAANRQLAAENLSYQELAWHLRATLAEKERLVAELEKELGFARELQRSLLPPEMPEGLPLVAINLPARHLSGDFFDYWTTSDGWIWFALGDVSGKGASAALLLAKVMSLLRCLERHVDCPSELLVSLNEELLATTLRGMHVTLAVGRYHLEIGTLELGNAGHMPAILIDGKGQARTLGAGGPPVGVVPNWAYEVYTTRLRGGSLCLYSDGLVEALAYRDVERGIVALTALLQEASQLPPPVCVARILRSLRVSTGSPTLEDDVTWLQLRS